MQAQPRVRPQRLTIGCCRGAALENRQEDSPAGSTVRQERNGSETSLWHISCLFKRSCCRRCQPGYCFMVVEVRESVDSFVHGSQHIAVERYEPVGPGPYPVILLLHGRDGMVSG